VGGGGGGVGGGGGGGGGGGVHDSSRILTGLSLLSKTETGRGNEGRG